MTDAELDAEIKILDDIIAAREADHAQWTGRRDRLAYLRRTRRDVAEAEAKLKPGDLEITSPALPPGDAVHWRLNLATPGEESCHVPDHVALRARIRYHSGM